MKKLLALVMALVMVMGLATVGTSAASVKYADASDITYKEAVDVMSEIGVLAGDESGFRPADTLKRSEGAKIVAYLMLGNKTAEALSGTGTKFTDVPANHWAAGYIEYLAAEGVLGGKGNGIFDPDGDLTTTQFAKMLLVALGYDAAIEGYGGPDWAINVQKQATKLNLFSGNSDVVGSAAVNREEAALYSLNTLKTPIVEYETKGTKIEVNGASITTGASNATYRLNTGKALARYQQIDNKTTNIGTTTSQIIEFAEEYYSKLVLTKNNDDFGRLQNYWTYDGKDIGKYVDDYDLLYTTEVTVGQIYKDLGLTGSTIVTSDGTATTANSTYYIDGVKIQDNPVTDTVENNSYLTLKKEEDTKLGGMGTETYVYYDEGKVRICELNWYVGDVSGVYAATSNRDAYVTVTTRNAANGYSGNFKTTNFAVEDVVVYNVALGGATPSIKNLTKAETVTGELSNYTGNADVGGTATIGGTKYAYSKKIANAATSELLSRGLSVDAVLDKYGYVIDIDDVGIRNYAVIIKIAGGTGAWNEDVQANLLLTDGTKTGAVTLDKVKGIGAGSLASVKAADIGTGSGKFEVGDIVEYAVNSDGTYNLTEVASAKSFANTAATKLVTNGDATINSTAFSVTGAAARVSGKTVFLVRDSSGSYTPYVGIKNVPTVETDGNNVAVTLNAYAKSDEAFASVVFVDVKDKGFVQTSETIFVAFDPDVKLTVDKTIGSYYEYKAVINGVPGLIKVSTGNRADIITTNLNGTTGGFGGHLFTSVSYNSNEIATLGGERKAEIGTMAEKNGAIGLGTKYYTYASDVKVFMIDEDDEVLASTIKGVEASDSGLVWYNTNASGDVNYVFWQKTGTAQTASATNYAGTTADVMSSGKTFNQYIAGDGVHPIVTTLTGGSWTTAAATGTTVTIPANATVILQSGNLTINGTANQDAIIVRGRLVIKDGALNVTTGNLIVDGGSVSMTKGLTIGANGHVELNGGNFTSTGTNVNTIDGTSLKITAGRADFSGKVLVYGTLEVSGTGNLTIGNELEFAKGGSDATNLVLSGSAVLNADVIDIDDLDSMTITGGSITTGKLETAVSVSMTNVTLSATATTVESGTLTLGSGTTADLGALTNNSAINNTSAAKVTATSTEGSGTTTAAIAVEDYGITVTVEGIKADITNKQKSLPSAVTDYSFAGSSSAVAQGTTVNLTVTPTIKTITYTAPSHSSTGTYAKAGDTVVVEIKVATSDEGATLPGDVANYTIQNGTTANSEFTMKSTEVELSENKKEATFQIQGKIAAD